MGSLDNNIRLIRNETVEGGNTKERIAETFDNIVAELGKKVDKVAGKILSSNDFTNELRQKLEGLQQVDTSGLLPKGGYTGTAQDLKNLINAINRILQSDDTDLDQLQEIVTYIKQNKHILSTLGISNIAGLVEALAAKAEKDHHHDERYAPITHHHNQYAHRTHRHNWDDIDGLPANIATTDNVKTAIDGIQIGGRNYILDSGEERYKEYRGTAEVYIVYQIVGGTLEKNTTYTLTIEYKSEDVRSVELFFINEDYTQAANKKIPNTNGEWKRDYLTFTTDNNTPKGNIRIDNNGSELGNVTSKLWTRNVKLEKGNKPTDWSPAPEDLATTEELMRKITRIGYEVSTDTVIPQAQQNDTVFVKASCTLGLQNIEHLGSVSFIKTFDTGAVTFTCAGKTIIMKGDTQFNGGKGSTAVVSIHNNDCYIRISNV
nr:MAG TPA: Minor structural protein 4 [Caudoviricetes sp.]